MAMQRKTRDLFAEYFKANFCDPGNSTSQIALDSVSAEEPELKPACPIIPDGGECSPGRMPDSESPREKFTEFFQQWAYDPFKKGGWTKLF